MSNLPSPPLLSAPGSSAELPDISLSKGEKLYVNLTFKGCAWGPSIAEMYVGSKEKHDQLIARAELPDPVCNYCHRCNCACFWPAEMKIIAADGAQVGTMQLGRQCSKICWLPSLGVNLNGRSVGTVQTRLCLCNLCPKDVMQNGAPIYSSKKFINNKLFGCFLAPCWNFYRTLLKNKTTVEYYTAPNDETQEVFEVINVSGPLFILIGRWRLQLHVLWLPLALWSRHARQGNGRDNQAGQLYVGICFSHPWRVPNADLNESLTLTSNRIMILI